MQEIVARAKANRISTLFAEVSITEKPFFEKHGFTVLSEERICKGVPLINYKMGKIIKNKRVVLNR